MVIRRLQYFVVFFLQFRYRSSSSERQKASAMPSYCSTIISHISK